MDEANSDHGQDHSKSSLDFSEAMLMSRMFQTVYQCHIDFPRVNHSQLHHYSPLLHHLHFYHLHFTHLAVLLLTNLHCEKQKL